MSLFARAADRRGTPADLLVIGLGNPGADYARTRHNAGADTVASLAQRHGERLSASRKERAEVAEIRLPPSGTRVALAFPTTFYNESGVAASALVKRFGVEAPERVVVVHDELDLDLGRLKVKLGGGLAGNNGLKSIKAHLGTDAFVRIRIGVGKPPGSQQGRDHVLRRVGAKDRELLDVAIGDAADAVEMIATQGLDATMQRYNQRS